ncbi:MAG: DUF167 domain-containing protein [Sutterella sp.]
MPSSSESPFTNTSWLSIGKNGNPILALHAQPGAKRTTLAGLYGNKLKIALASPPVDGKANSLLIKFLSKELGLPKASLLLISGETSREKRLEVIGITADELLTALKKAFSSG